MTLSEFESVIKFIMQIRYKLREVFTVDESLKKRYNKM